MKSGIKVSIRKKGEQVEGVDPALQQRVDEAVHFVQGLRKKGDNVKQMMEKLNEHEHKHPDGSDWSYDSLQGFIAEHHI
ncbi:hypothetical protein Q4508_05265 [Amphritea sp. 2_MG-2023]|jgi:hypothetical protein|uniref:hypothetical protein n=1 Tax=Amphritea TaxID=515417 RepID=UPI001C072088|nr:MULTISPECIES: hypothetical protein [Amphritea]MBU2965872.1 hypothetical protein [Amphritea atlantica]MDO6417962.1 hypothetical protein [Amphritea sp. 2_MG-2023]